LPRELDGVRIAHLSDFHLGIHGRGPSAVERAVDWVAERRPDLTCITGDLLTKPKGERQLRELLARLDHPYIVLGNHDFAHSRDPFSKPAAIAHVDNGTLLADDQVELELRGVRVEIGGVDPLSWLSYRPSNFAPSDAGFRLLLCHFPRVLDFVDPGRWQLILAGHLHGGQIVLPYGRGRFLFAHPRAPYAEGVFERDGTTMHVSPGLGTTFVPFRYFARPEATELVLRCR
jgi:predicted MPP superfamily phosphohydrolase